MWGKQHHWRLNHEKPEVNINGNSLTCKVEDSRALYIRKVTLSSSNIPWFGRSALAWLLLGLHFSIWNVDQWNKVKRKENRYRYQPWSSWNMWRWLSKPRKHRPVSISNLHLIWTTPQERKLDVSTSNPNSELKNCVKWNQQMFQVLV